MPSEKPVRFEERFTVVAIYEVPQRDEPPGRGDTRKVEVPLHHHTTELRDADVAAAIRSASIEAAGR